jgi:glucosamine-6-phosphate isomerase
MVTEKRERGAAAEFSLYLLPTLFLLASTPYLLVYCPDMQLNIYKDYETLSSNAADEVIGLLKAKPTAVLCLAAGDTPRLTYLLLAQKAKQQNVDFSRCTFVGLDEWVGIPPQNEGSCHFFLRHQLFNPLQISSSQAHLFDALAGNLSKECEKMDNVIREIGGIDLMLVGVGMNGHIGFNEPGVSFDKYSHVIDLDETTQSVGQKYFKQSTALKKGITLGLNHLKQARRVLLIANGIKKAQVIRKAIEEEMNVNMPASIIQSHEQGIVMIDEEAGSLLSSGFKV